jgi:probable DNA repair protein
VRDALRILRLGLQRVALKEVVALLQTRFARLPDAGSSLAALFLVRLHEDRRDTIPVADLRHAASQTELDGVRGLSLGRYLMAMFTMRELQRPAPPSAWIERIAAVLDLWGWPGPGPLDSLEYQQVERWHETLEAFAGYDGIHPSLRLEAALQLLERCLAREVSQPQSADSNVQVLGPLEAAGLAFDHLWLCGMQGSSWPAPPRPNPFIPVALQRRLQMPHASAEREWAFADGLMQQYRRSTAELIASYSRQLEGIPDTASALLDGFAAYDRVATAATADPWQRQWQAGALEMLPDGTAPPVDEAELASLRGGSGLLEDQSHCPFRAFARRRLQVEPLPGAAVGLSSAERGALLHHVLFILWGELGDSGALTALQPEAEEQLVSAAVEQALDAMPARRRSGQRAFIELERRRLKDLVGEWLTVERSRAEAFVVYRREEGVQLSLERLEISLRVDRIDQLPDGSLAVIDYKSGRGSLSDWLGERPAKPQLLLYGIAAPAPPAAIAFARIRPRDCAFVGLGRTAVAPGISTDIGKSVRNRSDAPDWESLNEEWRAHLERLAREFLAGEARVDPLSPASCAWCNLQPLCRVGQASDEEPVE